MSDRIKMGLIGCGGMSGAHMRGLSRALVESDQIL